MNINSQSIQRPLCMRGFNWPQGPQKLRTGSCKPLRFILQSPWTSACQDPTASFPQAPSEPPSSTRRCLDHQNHPWDRCSSLVSCAVGPPACDRREEFQSVVFNSLRCSRTHSVSITEIWARLLRLLRLAYFSIMRRGASSSSIKNSRSVISVQYAIHMLCI